MLHIKRITSLLSQCATMAATGKKYVYVLSRIPRLAQLVQEALPDVNVVDLKMKGRGFGPWTKETQSEVIGQLQDAEVLLADNDYIAEVSLKLPKLRWAQGTWAGVEVLTDYFKDKPKPTFPITRMVGDAFSQLMAEYTIGRIITHERNWLLSHECQLKSIWSREDKFRDYRSLGDLTVGILGVGNIGKEVAKCLKAFRCQVHGYTRSVPKGENRCRDIDRYWHTGELSSFLKECDYFVNIMPSTPETRGMLDGDVLKDAKEGAVFINIGRGSIISDEDLIHSLDSGWLSAAILDVFNKEPLPPESRLWKHPKVEITPHNAGTCRPGDVSKTFIDNYKRYSQGLPALHPIQWNVGY